MAIKNILKFYVFFSIMQFCPEFKFEKIKVINNKHKL